MALKLEPKTHVRCFEQDRLDGLIHIGVKKLASLNMVGQQIKCNHQQGRSTGVRNDRVHITKEDATRLVYIKLLPDEQHDKTWTLKPGISLVQRAGCRVSSGDVEQGPRLPLTPTCQGIQGFGLEHNRSKPDRPRTNDKAERFRQTICKEWAYSIPLQNSVDGNL